MENMFGNQNYYSAFNQKSIRKNFIQKVFSIVGIQLFVTFMVVSLFRNVYVLSKLSDSLLGIACVVSIVTCFWLSCSKKTARSYPKNYIILAVFTFSEAILVENILAYYDSKVIYQSAFMTAVLVGVLATFAQFTKIDFTSGKQLGILLLVHFVVILFGFMFFSFHSVLYSVIMLVLFCAYVVLDLQMIMGDRNRKLQIDDYVLAAMILYTDIIQIFLKLVELLSDKDSRSNRKRRSNRK